MATYMKFAVALNLNKSDVRFWRIKFIQSKLSPERLVHQTANTERGNQILLSSEGMFGDSIGGSGLQVY